MFISSGQDEISNGLTSNLIINVAASDGQILSITLADPRSIPDRLPL